MGERFWEQIPLSLNGTNAIDGVKIIRSKETPLARIPPTSNTPDTMYIISNAKGEIKYITEYRDNKIVFSIDFDYIHGVHGHVWELDEERESHKKDNAFRVPARYKDLVKDCVAYNHQHFKEPKEIKSGGSADIDIEKLLKERKGKKNDKEQKS